MNVPGLIAIIIFYLLILGVGLWAAWRRRNAEASTDEVILAGRSIGPFVGVLTMTATWVGGGYINGSAEAVFRDGLLYCQAPFGYAISLTLGGIFFAKQMRDAQYVTMLDPLQDVFGKRWGAMLYLPALAGETLWSAAILSALGSTLAVILNISNDISIIVSAAIAVVYTLFGGLYAVAYTDVVQLFCIFIGLWLSVPFAFTSEHVGSLALEDSAWLGSPPENKYEWGEWVDYAVLLIFGGIPWQVYFQRVLSARTSRQAQYLSYAASIGCFLMAVPACMIGAIAQATDWESTGYAKNITEDEQKKLVLPLVLQYLTPPWVAFFGLGAVSAAVMSSADSSVLSASSMFANNIYKNVFRSGAGQREILWVMRVAVVIVAIISTVIAIESDSVYDLFHLCGDLVYVMLFPQLTWAVHGSSRVNTYGSIAAFTIGLILRLIGGESILGLPVLVEYPWYNERQLFPFRTLAMVATFITLPLVSWLTKYLFEKGVLPPIADFLSVFQDDNEVVISANKNPPPENGYDNSGLDLKDVKKRSTSHKQSVEMTNF